MNEKVKVIKVELKQEYGEEKLKTYYPEDVELDDIIMSVYSLLNFTSIMFEYSSYPIWFRHVTNKNLSLWVKRKHRKYATKNQ